MKLTPSLTSVTILCPEEKGATMSNLQTKRLHIKIKGKNHHTEAKKLMDKAVKELNMTGYMERTDSEVLMVAEGTKEQTWGLIQKVTQNKFKAKIEEILFYFKDVNSGGINSLTPQTLA